MQPNDININLNVTSNGTLRTENDEAKSLAASLKAAQASATGASKALAGAKSATTSRARVKAPSLDEQLEYGISRSTTGTGAASRDFAKQSHGLGGLVRLYATFAANIFALTAAFTALSNAADTSNLIKGLDQLGASSGRALGTLSKRLADASDGAISLRDSMESVAKASSAGLNDRQILQLGESARQASQALGLSMPDALNRLTRGISKLEPELLDELGIFVRIDDATRKYGLSVGKAAASLTDFERRQAFANAVLDQAKAKFGDIKLEVNPYSKLLATFQNVSFAGLEMVNKVLTPLVKLLSENPTALAAVLAGIGTKLLATAIPAIGQWRGGLKRAVEDAKQAAEDISNSFGDKFNSQLQASFRVPNLEKDLDATKKKILEVTKSLPTSTLGTGPVSLLKAAPSLGNVKADEAGLRTVNSLLSTREGYIQTGIKDGRTLSANKQAQYAAEITALKAQQSEIIKRIELTKLLNLEIQKQKALDAANADALNFASKNQNRFDTEKIAIEATKRARLDYDKLSAVSNAAEAARTLGVERAWKNLNVEIAEKGITGVNKFTTLAKGGLAAVSTRVLGIAGSFSNILPAAMIAFAGFELLSMWLSKNSKENDAFNSAIDDTNKAVKNLDATFDKIAKKDPLEQFSISSLSALATAFETIAGSTDTLVSSLGKAHNAAGWFDIFIDRTLAAVGKDLRTTFNKQFVPSIVSAFEKMPEGEAKEAYAEKLTNILGVTGITVQSVQDSLDKLDPSQLLNVTASMVNAQNAVAANFKKSADAANSYKESLNGSVKAYQEMMLSMASSDPISKLGSSLITSGIAMTTVINDATFAVGGLIEVLNDSTKMALLPEGAQKALVEYSKSIKGNQEYIVDYSKRIADARKEVEKLKKTQGTLTTDAGGNSVEEDNAGAVVMLEAKIADYKKGILVAETRQKSIIESFLNAGSQVFATGVELLNRQITAASHQASLALFRAKTQQATGVAKVVLDANSQKEEIDIQLQLLDVQERLVKAMTVSNLLQTQAALAYRAEDLDSKRGPRSDAEEAERASISKQMPLIAEAIGRAVSNKGYAGMGKEAYSYIQPLAAAEVSTTARRIKLQSDRQVIDVNKDQGVEAERFKAEQKRLTDVKAIIAAEKERVDIINSSALSESASLLLRQQELANAIDQLDVEMRRNELVEQVVAANKVYNVTLGKQGSAAKEAIAAAKETSEFTREQLGNFDDQVVAKRKIKDITQAIMLYEQSSAMWAKEAKQNSEDVERGLNADIAKQNSAKEYLDYLIKAKVISEESGIIRMEDIEQEILKKKELLDVETAQQASRDAQKPAQDKLTAGIIAAGPDDDEARTAHAEEYIKAILRIQKIEDDRIAQIKQQTAEKSKLVALVAKEETQYAKIAKFGDTLAKAFGHLGGSVAKAAAGIGNVLKTFAQTDNRRVAMAALTAKKLEKIDRTTAKGKEEYKKEEINAAKESLEFELDAGAEQASAAKSLFAEKTFAFKAFAAVEKAIHVAKLAMMLQEIAGQIGLTTVSVAQSGTRASAFGIEAIVNAMKNLPTPLNYAAGAIMAGIVASLLGGGGKKVSIPAGVSAKDVQEVQGTGMSYVNGKQVENGNGTFGDTSQKSKSIENSLDIIKRTNVEGITVSNDMLKYLEKIAAGITKAAMGLYGTPGIRTPITGMDVTSSKSSPLGFLGNSGLMGALSGSIFGKKVTKSILDSGIAFKGVFTDLIKAGNKAISQYETTNTTTKRSGLLGIGSSTSSSTSRVLSALKPETQALITDVFTNVTDLFIEQGEKLGLTTKQVLDNLSTVKIDELASLKGLKGSELEEELAAVMGSIMDQGATALFSSLKKYRKFGEGMLETTTRVIDTNEKIKDSFTSIGKSQLSSVVSTRRGGLFGFGFGLIRKDVTALSFDVTEALATLSGGLENFLDNVSSYKDNFLSEAEQLAPIRNTVTSELGKLGFGAVKTAEDFKYLVASMDVSTSKGREGFVALLNIQESFARVVAADEATADLRANLLEAEGKTGLATGLRRAKELKQLSAVDAELQKRIWLLEDEKQVLGEAYSYEYKILELLGRSEEALALARAQELKELDDHLLAVQRYVYAIEDEISIRERATKGIESTIGSFKNSISALLDLKSSLLGGDKTILTPQQKYDQAKAEANAVIQAASAPASSIEDILVREQAISKLPNVTNAWLEASRNLFASSTQYTQDFNTVLSAVSGTSAFLETQLTDAEKQLEVIKQSSNILTSIDDNTLSTVDLLNKFLVAAENTRMSVATAPTSVNGTINSNISIPEPTINTDLVAELISFNKEALKQQIKEERDAAQAIIIANRQAAQQSAAAIQDALREAMSKLTWQSQNGAWVRDQP